MPRANRYFLPGYVWHITHLNSNWFRSFQRFNRFAPFKTFQAMEVPNGPKVSVVPIAALESHKQTTANVNLGWVLKSSLGRTERTNRWNQLALFGLWLRGVPELLNEYAMTGHLLGLPYRGI
jgi:hypothetical protein